MIFKTRPNYFTTFDGVNEGVKAISNLHYKFEWTDTWSFGCWVKPDITTNLFPLVTNWFDQTGYLFFINGTGRVSFQLRSGAFINGRCLAIQTADNTITSNELVHILITYDGGGVTASAKAYVNGVLLNWDNVTFNTINASTIQHPGTRFQMGTESTSLGWYGEGEYHDCRVWDKVLDQDEVDNEYNEGSAIQETPTAIANLIGHCTFGEDYTWTGSVIQFTDQSDTFIRYDSVNMTLDNLNIVTS
jgi:hypothetical protein